MRVILNLAISACLLLLAIVNLTQNPFISTANAQAEYGCEGDPPGENCGCCEECRCWNCE